MPKTSSPSQDHHVQPCVHPPTNLRVRQLRMHLSTKKKPSQRQVLKAKCAKQSARLKAKRAKERAQRIANIIAEQRAAEDIVPKDDVPKERLPFKPIASVSQLEQDPAAETPVVLPPDEYQFFIASLAQEY